jgi:anion-transporting  ArsA/GET3 family ATPase
VSTPIAEALGRQEVIVCVGAGGVGKTTISATLALRAAVEGRSALVCTIDPARRLASSLGLSELGNTETRIPDEVLSSVGKKPKAGLYAMMLDMKQTWDALIERYATPDKRERIVNNRFYQSLSSRLAGSQEYIAMEKLWELHNHRDYSLIVLDTPPTAHALDFLDAPNRVLDFLDNEAARWLLTPALAAGKVGLQLFNLGGSYVAKQLSKLTGGETLQELSNFMLAMSGMNQDFRERAQQVRQLLAADKTSFVIVTTPHTERIDEVVHFHTLLRQNHMRIAAVVVNRTHAPPKPEAWEAARGLSGPLRQKAETTLREAETMATQDAACLAELRRLCDGTPLVEVPRFDLDVHDLPALWRTSRYLLGEDVLERPAALTRG